MMLLANVPGVATEVYVGPGGAVVCERPGDVQTYFQLGNDVEAKKAFLASSDGAGCSVHKADEKYTWLPTELLNLLSIPPERRNPKVIQLRKPGDYKTVYGISPHWEKVTTAGLAELKACRPYAPF
jgi:hypothetical protein